MENGKKCLICKGVFQEDELEKGICIYCYTDYDEEGTVKIQKKRKWDE